MTKTIGFLFPGQGAQFVGMGKDFYEQSPAAQEIYNQADQTLGYSISRICFQGPESELTRTLYAQTGILVTSLAALAVLRERFSDLKPSLVAGLSLGEFTALVASDAIDFKSALKLVQIRAEAMEIASKNHPGTMASVMGLDLEKCIAVAQKAGCEIANLNTPDQTVLSGTFPAIEKACRIAEDEGAKRAIPLKVGGAFHSSLMLKAKEQLETALKETTIRKPSCTFIPNVTAQKVSDPETIRSLLARQLTSSVQWVKTLAAIHSEGITELLEIGPGKVLKGLARKTQPGLSVSAFGTLGDFSGLESLNLFTKV